MLHWNYEQSKLFPDLVGQIVKQFNGKGIDKYRLSVIQHLLQQVRWDTSHGCCHVVNPLTLLFNNFSFFVVVRLENRK